MSFNSLFEMPALEFLKMVFQLVESFNSLFEMPIFLSIRLSAASASAFNSLFEMRVQLGGVFCCQAPRHFQFSI